MEQTRTSFDQVPSADEESRNTLEVIGGRGEAPATECKVELLKGRRIVSNESRPKEEFERTCVTKTEDMKERGRPSKAPSNGLVKKTISTT